MQSYSVIDSYRSEIRLAVGLACRYTEEAVNASTLVPSNSRRSSARYLPLAKLPLPHQRSTLEKRDQNLHTDTPSAIH